MIGTRQQLYKVQTSSISVGESRISPSKEVRSLELGWTTPSQCLLTSARLPLLASITSITSDVLESISLGESVKLSLMLLSRLVLTIVTASCMVPHHPS